MDLMEHLDELRGRLLRCILYAGLAGIISWYWIYDPVYNALTAPLNRIYREHHLQGGLIYLSLTEPFFLKLKVCTLIALALTSPMLLWEAWGFIAPGLYPSERRPFKLVFPMAVGLFAMGAGLAYSILPAAFAWFLSYMPANVQLQQRLPDYLLFVVKMCGAFGLGFELPVVLMFLGKIGLLRARTMKQYWRQAVVLIMIVAAIITPSNDPFSMLMMATPMAFLYIGSISLVRWVEPPYEAVPYGSDEEVTGEPRPARARPIDLDEED